MCDGEKKHMKKLSRELIYAALHSDVHDAAKSKEPNSKNGSGGLVLLTLPPKCELRLGNALRADTPICAQSALDKGSSTNARYRNCKLDNEHFLSWINIAVHLYHISKKSKPTLVRAF